MATLLFALVAPLAVAESGAQQEAASASVDAAPDASSDPCSEAVARRVQRYYDSVEDFSADFAQSTQSVLFGSSSLAAAESARGRVVFAKPGKMRWTYTHPEPSLVVTDGETLWLYSPTLKEAQRLPMTEGYLTGAALSFLLGEGKLFETFDVTAAACGAGPRVELSLSPRQPTSYERLGLTVVESTGEVVSTSVVDVFGNETRIAFEHVERNQHPSPALFQFEPDPDVRVVELEGP